MKPFIKRFLVFSLSVVFMGCTKMKEEASSGAVSLSGDGSQVVEPLDPSSGGSDTPVDSYGSNATALVTNEKVCSSSSTQTQEPLFFPLEKCQQATGESGCEPVVVKSQNVSWTCYQKKGGNAVVEVPKGCAPLALRKKLAGSSSGVSEPLHSDKVIVSGCRTFTDVEGGIRQAKTSYTCEKGNFGLVPNSFEGCVLSEGQATDYSAKVCCVLPMPSPTPPPSYTPTPGGGSGSATIIRPGSGSGSSPVMTPTPSPTARPMGTPPGGSGIGAGSSGNIRQNIGSPSGNSGTGNPLPSPIPNTGIKASPTPGGAGGSMFIR